MGFVDICPHCDGTGERCILSGAKCYHCDGSGIREEPDFEDDEPFDEDEEEADDHE